MEKVEQRDVDLVRAILTRHTHSDFSAIEAVAAHRRQAVEEVVAWLRGEADNIDALRRNDATMEAQRFQLDLLAKARRVCADAIEAGQHRRIER